VDAALFEPAAGHDLISAHYLVEKLPFKLELGCFSELTSLPCDFTVVVAISPGSMEQKQAEEMEKQQLSKLMMLTGVSRDLSAGRKLPFEVSTNLILLMKRGLNMQALASTSLIKKLGDRKDLSYKYVRSRILPFSAVFCEPLHYYPLIVSEEGATACCPFFLQPEVIGTPRVRTNNSPGGVHADQG
jgi:hypothetical protein